MQYCLWADAKESWLSGQGATPRQPSYVALDEAASCSVPYVLYDQHTLSIKVGHM